MAITTPVPIPAGPPVPNSNDPETTFDAQFEASLAWQRNELAPKANDLAAATFANAQDSQASALAAQASEAAAALAALNAAGTANFKGLWSSLGAVSLAPPASVSHLGITWNLVSAVPNVSLAVPGTSPAWEAINTVFPVEDVNTATVTMVAGREYKFRYSGKITATMPAQVEGAGVVVTICNGRRDNVLLRAAPTDSFMGKAPDDITLVTPGRFALRALFNSWRGF